MVNRHRVLLRDLVQIMDVEGTLVLDFGVVVEIALDPEARRRLRRTFAELVDDAADGHELDFERIAHQHFVQQGFAFGMVVAIDEPRDDGSLTGVDDLRALAGERLDLVVGSHRHEAIAADGNGLSPWHPRIHRPDAGIEEHEVCIAWACGGRRGAQPGPSGQGCKTGACKSDEPATIAVAAVHEVSPIAPSIPILKEAIAVIGNLQ